MSESIDGASGKVWLVGAGPGDPELLTLRAWRLIREADVVLYDNLVSAEVLDLLPASAQRLYVGKQRGNHALPQDDIGRRMVELARAGRRVLRLKGGDPFIFGRGGEEVEALVRAGIDVEVVPGITAALGAAAAAKIPLTHRDHAQSCYFVAGHLKAGKLDLDWPALVRSGQTLVIYMGLVSLSELCRQLIDHGLAPTTPAALIEQATTPRQRILTTALVDLPAKAVRERAASPVLIIVGRVAAVDWLHQPGE